MLKAFKYLLVFLIIANVCLSESIIPDPNFPVLVKNPRRGVTTSTVFEFRFKLPTRADSSSSTTAYGIGYNQFIGIKFVDGTFNFSTITPTCALSSSTTTFPVTRVSPVSTTLATTSTLDTSTVYCQLTDQNTNRLPAGETLTLSLTFSVAISTSWIHNISIFTSTSNNSDQLIIDKLPNIGSVGLYSDYAISNNNKLIEVTNGGGSSLATVTSPTGQSTDTLYPGFTFDTRIILQVQQFWMVNPSDFLIYVKFSTDSFTLPTNVSTEAYSTDTDELALSSTIGKTDESDGIILTGFTKGQLYPGRKFVVVLEGMTALDKELETTTSIEVLVYYKNTYSIISYSTINMDTVKIVTLTAAVHHPDYFYMYDGMGWPFQFDITSPVAIASGGYIVIRQKNKTNINSVNLVASTCDFSNTAIDQQFGRRWNCYPLRNDFNFDVTGADSTAAGGVFFKMSSLAASTTYSVIIWGFIDKCYTAANQTKNYATTLTFTVRIFKTAINNDTYLNEKIFFSNTDNYIIARNTAVTLTEGCWPLQTRSDYSSNKAAPDNVITEANVNYDWLPLYRVEDDNWAPATPTADYNRAIGIELTNLFVVNPSAESDLANVTSKSTLFYNYALETAENTINLYNNNSKLTVSYLFGETSSDNSDANLTIFALFQGPLITYTTGAANKYGKAWIVQNYLPNECVATNLNTYVNTTGTISEPRIQWLFSRTFLTGSNSIDSGCQVSWVLIDDYNRTDVCPTQTLFYNDSAANGNNTHLTTITSVDITKTNGLGKRQANMLKLNSQINTATSTTGTDRTFKITSDTMIDSSGRTLSMIGMNCYSRMKPLDMTGILAADSLMTNIGQIGVHTNCLKWNVNSTTTSLFSYFEMQQVLLHNQKYPTRVWRFIKLYPELGFFQNPATTDSATATIVSTSNKFGMWIVGHYENTSYNHVPYSVCIIEIRASIINSYKGSSNTLLIWLFATSLIDIDITDVTSEYPVAPVSVTAYGNNSGQTMSMNFRRISDPSAISAIDGRYPDLSTSKVGEIEKQFLNQIINLDYDGVSRINAGFKLKRTMYQFFLGSLIYIPSASESITGNSSYNMYIPILCPAYTQEQTGTSTTYPTNGVYWTYPTVTVAWASMTAYNNVSSVDSFVSPIIDTDNERFVRLNNPYLPRTFTATGGATLSAVTTGNILPIHTPLWLYGSSDAAIFTSNPRYTATNSIQTRMDYFVNNYLETKYLPYTKTEEVESTKLILTLKGTDTSREFTTISLFLSEKVGTLSDTVSGVLPVSYLPDDTFKVYKSSNKMYILGKPFNRFLCYGRDRENGEIRIETTEAITISTSIDINGIPRLDVSTYNSSTSITPVDYIAVFTSYSISRTTKGQNVSNIRINATASVGYFLLHHPELSNDEWTAIISLDTSDKAIAGDYGANFKIVGSLPTSVPQGSNLTLTIGASVIQASTSVCGMMENGSSQPVTECIESATSVSCTFTAATQNFSICCYNILNSNTSISSTQGSLTLPLSTTTTASLLTSDVLSYTSETFPNTWYTYPATASLLTNNYSFSDRKVADVTSTDSTFYARLTNIYFTQSSSVNGFGKALFEVVLPRRAVRGMTLDINIDLTSLNISSNISPKIVPVFGNSQLYGASYEQGDLFLNDVFTDLDTNGISLRLKNILYKCGLILADRLNIYVWPVLTPNVSASAVSIDMKGPGSNTLAASISHTVTSTPAFSNSKVVSGVNTDLFTVSSISPRVIQEYAQYTFTFSFSSYSTTLASSTGNEVVFFFPFDLYSNYDVTCSNGTTQLKCEWIEENMLSVRLSTAITFTSDTALAINVIGIYNPYIASTNSVYIAASVNNTNFNDRTRYALITGIANVANGTIPNSSTTTNYYNLVFKNELCYHTYTIPNTTSGSGQSVFEEDPLSPREDPTKYNSTYQTLHKFGFTLDIANLSLTSWSNGYTLSSSPSLYITFPKQYKFSLSTFTPTVSVQAFFMDQTDNSVIAEKASFVTVKAVTLVGNQIRITFNEASLIFTEYFQYFTVSVFNAPAPYEATTVDQYTTNMFDLLLFNSDSSTVFRTFTNLNNFSNTNFTAGQISDLLPQNKGLQYIFDQTKWVIDVKDKTYSTTNSIVSRSGRYLTYYLSTRSNGSNFVNPGKVDVTLTNATFTFKKDTYTVVTSLDNDIAFQMGCACTTNPGQYLMTPTLSNSNVTNLYNLFYPLSPVTITLKRDTTGVISFTQTYSVRKAGSTFVDFTVTEPPYADISIAFASSTDYNSSITSNVIAAGSTSVRSVFRMSNSDSVDIQAYTLDTSNVCYSFQYSRIIFVIDGVAAIIPNDAITRPMFTYNNSGTDSTLLTNQVKFTFDSVYNQVYLYAVVTCMDNEFPTDDYLRAQEYTANNTHAYYNEIITTVGDSVDLTFSNLVRGQVLKIKVIAESTQGDSLERTYTSLEMMNGTFPNGTVTDIIATKSITPICSSYRFVTRPGTQVTNPLLWYWQYLYSQSGYESNGCITAVDQYGNQAPGLPQISNEVNCGTANCRFIDYNNYIVNQTSLGVSETYTICAYPLSYCETDPSTYSDIHDTILTNLATNSSFPGVLNVLVVPEFTITDIDETVVPQAPTVTDVTYANNKITFTAVSTTSISCFVIADDGAGNAPTQSDFNTCGVGCTVADISAVSGSYSVSVTQASTSRMLQNTTTNTTTCNPVTTTYNVYAICSNSAPCSQLDTEILKLGSATKTTEATDCTDTSTTTTNSSFLSSNILMLFALVFAFLF